MAGVITKAAPAVRGVAEELAEATGLLQHMKGAPATPADTSALRAHMGAGYSPEAAAKKVADARAPGGASAASPTTAAAATSPGGSRGASGTWGPAGTAGALGAAGAASSTIGPEVDDPSKDSSNLPADLRDQAAAAASGGTPPPTTPPPPTRLTAPEKPTEVATPGEVEAGPKPAKLKTPGYAQEIYDKIGAEVGENGERLSDPGYLAKLSVQDKKGIELWDTKRAELRQDMLAAKERIGRAEVAEIFGKALARIGAGLYGLKTGYDLSGADFSVSDWSKRYDLAHQEYKTELQQAEQAFEARQKMQASLRRDVETNRERLDRAGVEVGRVSAATEAENRRQYAEYANNKMEADKFNKGRQYDAARDKVKSYEEWQKQVRDAEKFNLELGQKEKAVESRATTARGEQATRLEVAKIQAANKSAKTDSKQEDDYNAAVGQLRAIDSLPDKGGLKGKTQINALRSIGAHLDPKTWADVQQKAIDNKGWGESLNESLYRELQALPPPTSTRPAQSTLKKPTPEQIAEFKRRNPGETDEAKIIRELTNRLNGGK